MLFLIIDNNILGISTLFWPMLTLVNLGGHYINVT
jgi:hypothetical protein